MNNFEDIISDEMLSAYIDGNAISIENSIIGEYLDDAELQEVLDIVSDIKANPEIIEYVEYKEGEIPEQYFEGLENPLQEIRKEIEDTGKHIM